MQTLRNVTGTWECESENADTSPFTKSGAAWLAPVCASVKILLHTPSVLRVESSIPPPSGGADCYTILLSGRWQTCVHDPQGLVQKHTASVDVRTGDVLLEHEIVCDSSKGRPAPLAGRDPAPGASTGLLVERLSLVSNHVLEQKLTWYADSGDAAAGGQPSMLLTRKWRRCDSAEEAALWDELQAQAAKQLSVTQEAVMYSSVGYPVVAYGPGRVRRASLVAASLVPLPADHSSPDRAQATASPQVSSPTPRPVPAVIEPTAEQIAAFADFTGTWAVDKRAGASESLEPMLTMMGVPWLARKAAEGIEVLTCITHTPARLSGKAAPVLSEDRASFGVLATTNIEADGVRVSRTGKDGKTAALTCTIEAPAADMIATDPDAVAVLRIVTELPDGAGTNNNAWILLGGAEKGKVMKQLIVFTKGAQSCTIRRTLISKDWTAAQAQSRSTLASMAKAELDAQDAAKATVMSDSTTTTTGSDSLSSVSATSATTSTVEQSVAVETEARLPASAMPAVVVPEATLPPAMPSARSTLLLPADDTNPFFVSMGGAWTLLLQSGGASRDAAKAFRESLGAEWPKDVVSSFLATNLTLLHACGEFAVRQTEGGSSSSTSAKAPVKVSLTGQWQTHKAGGVKLSTRGLQLSGLANTSEAWLGVETGHMSTLLIKAMGHGIGARYLSSSETIEALQALGNPTLWEIPGTPSALPSVFDSSSSTSSVTEGELLASAMSPLYSTAEFNKENYVSAEVILELCLGSAPDVDAPARSSAGSQGGASSPRAGKGAQKVVSQYSLHATGHTHSGITLQHHLQHVGADGHVLASCTRTFTRPSSSGQGQGQGQGQASFLELERKERARLATVRSILLQRRAKADKIRRALALAISGQFDSEDGIERPSAISVGLPGQVPPGEREGGEVSADAGRPPIAARSAKADFRSHTLPSSDTSAALPSILPSSESAPTGSDSLPLARSASASASGRSSTGGSRRSTMDSAVAPAESGHSGTAAEGNIPGADPPDPNGLAPPSQGTSAGGGAASAALAAAQADENCFIM